MTNLCPHPDDALMAQAWADCLSWALSEADIRKTFEVETGNHFSPGRTPIDRAIDEATGYGEAYVLAFAAWFNANIWGDPDNWPEEE